MSDQFSGPAESTGIQWADLNGCLLLFEVQALEKEIKTSFGEKDAVRAVVHVLDGEAKGDKYDSALIFPSVLIGQLRPRLGGMVLGRLFQGEKKAGQQPPWKLSEPTEDDKKTATAYLAKTPAKAPF